MLDTLIRGGTVVSDGAIFQADVGIEGGTIAGVWRGEHGLTAAREVDAAGKIVMPGGIDVHFHTQTGGIFHSTRADNMETATISAALGGVTTVLPFVWGDQGQPLEEFMGRFFELAGELAVCDYSAHCGLRPEWDLIAQIPRAFSMGVTSFKLTYAYRKTGQGRMSEDDHHMMALELIARGGGLAMFHCENGQIIDYLEDKFIREGKTTHHYFLKSRPNLAESETIHRSIVLGELTGCPVYVVHLSAREGLEEIAEAQARGKAVFTETCPQYLTLTDAELERWGVLAKIGPPLRLEPDLQAMWQGLRQGTIETIGSDHSAASVAAKNSAGDNFFMAPFGTAMVEVMMPVVYSEGVAKGRITLERFVSAFTDRPARRFGLYPRKGTLQPGSDADVLIWDPDAVWTVRASELKNPCGYHVFDGWTLKGRPWRSWLRGQPLVQDGQVLLPRGSGRKLHRSGAAG